VIDEETPRRRTREERARDRQQADRDSYVSDRATARLSSRARSGGPARPRTGAKRTLMGTIRDLPAYLKLLFGLMSDSAVSRVDRLLVVGAIAYIVSPIDLLPDVIPFLGQVDDVYLLVLAIQRLVKRAGRGTVMRYWRGDPRALSDKTLARVVGAATFFLPGRTKQKITRLMGRW
jgi:uncharacterized membrane protein YkvA (DUF1232 family)